MDIKQLREQVDKLFSGRGQLVTLFQELAENFYPQRADFTLRREMGDSYAENLETSYPVMVARELQDQIGMMLRPNNAAWFAMKPKEDERETNNAKRWLEWATGIQKRAMYDRVSRFTRAIKETDGDFATFGQAVISRRLGKGGDTLLFRCWHLRDVVWMENEEGEICLVALKWKPSCYELNRLFGSKCHPQIGQYLTQNKHFETVECYHIVLMSELWTGDPQGKPWQSIYYDCQHNHMMEQVGVWDCEYVIPRWQTVSGSQYAYSPASVIALPDARLLQAMTGTLLDAGERNVNPPLVATKDAVKSDVQAYSGGITWVEYDYDERLGPALKELVSDAGGMPIGIEMQRDARALLRECFYLHKLQLPNTGQAKTAYEVSQLVQDYIRGALPIFEPMEADYNGQVCESTFNLMLRNGAFGSPFDMPDELQGAEIEFRFESPLHDAIEQQKGHKFLEMKQLIAEAMALDQSALALPDVKIALRDALNGVKIPAKWIRSEVTVEQIESAQRAAAETEKTLAAVEQASVAAKNYAGAEKDLSQAAA